MKTNILKYGKTDKGFVFVESGNHLIQKDRRGNWNAFIGGIVKNSYENLSDALEFFLGVKLDTKNEFEIFTKEYTSIWREMMREVMRDFS